MKASSDKPGDSRLPELDGIRGLAIILVLIKHYLADSIIPGASRPGDWVRTVCTMGWTGVDLFFVLSGFLIGGILMDQRNSEHYFKTFYIRRGCRILPVHFLNVAAFHLALLLLFAGYHSQYWFSELFTRGGVPPFWTNLTLTQNFFFLATGRYNADWLFPTWSLVVEEQFYLLLPLAIWILRPSWLVPTLLSVTCLYPFLQLYLLIFDPRQYDIVGTVLPIRGDALLVGVICACMLRRAGCKTWLAQNNRQQHVMFLLLLLGMVYVTPRYTAPMFHYEQILVCHLLVALFYASLLLLVVSHREGVIAATMRLAPLRKMGMISYAVFLFNLPVNSLLRGLVFGKDRMFREPFDLVITILAFFVTVLMASLSWRYLEKPIIAWGHSFHYGKQPDKPVVPAPQIPLPPAS
jgi:peptidoglycan/LPS O-acetylase OafA/YrhL